MPSQMSVSPIRSSLLEWLMSFDMTGQANNRRNLLIKGYQWYTLRGLPCSSLRFSPQLGHSSKSACSCLLANQS